MANFPEILPVSCEVKRNFIFKTPFLKNVWANGKASFKGGLIMPSDQFGRDLEEDLP